MGPWPDAWIAHLLRVRATSGVGLNARKHYCAGVLRVLVVHPARPSGVEVKPVV